MISVTCKKPSSGSGMKRIGNVCLCLTTAIVGGAVERATILPYVPALDSTGGIDRPALAMIAAKCVSDGGPSKVEIFEVVG